MFSIVKFTSSYPSTHGLSILPTANIHSIMKTSIKAIIGTMTVRMTITMKMTVIVTAYTYAVPVPIYVPIPVLVPIPEPIPVHIPGNKEFDVTYDHSL